MISSPPVCRRTLPIGSPTFERASRISVSICIAQVGVPLPTPSQPLSLIRSRSRTSSVSHWTCL